MRCSRCPLSDWPFRLGKRVVTGTLALTAARSGVIGPIARDVPGQRSPTVGDGAPLRAGTAKYDAEVGDVTAPVQVDAPAPGNGTVASSNDAVSGNGHGSDHWQRGLWAALRTKPLLALLIGV